MKRLLNRIASLAVMLAVALGTSCSKDAADLPTAPGDGIIRLSAEVVDGGGTKAPIVDGGAGAKAVLSDIHFLQKNGSTVQTDFSGFYAIKGSRDASGAITFDSYATPLTYDKTDLNAYIAAYWPSTAVGNAAIAPSQYVAWTIDGKTDILLSTLDPAASYDAGKYSAPGTGTLTFKHALAQLKVIIRAVPTDVASLAAVQNCWGTISSIGTANTAKKMTYTYATNAVTCVNFQGTSMWKPDYSAVLASYTIPAYTSTDVSAAAMLPPRTGVLRIKISSSKITDGVEVPVQLKDASGNNCDFEAGKSYTVTLTLGADPKQIGAKTTIGAWDPGYSAENKPAWTPRVGSYYYTDGTISWDILAGKTVEGVIFWVDSTDPFHFKITALIEPPASWKTYGNAEGRLNWSNVKTAISDAPYAASIVVADGSDGVARQSGLANHKIIRKYCAENTSGHTLANFPAARWCEEMRVDGRGGWVLPSPNEVEHLYCAYSGNTPTTWLTGKGPAAQEGYLEAFSTRFTPAGGKVMHYLNNIFIASALQSSSMYYVFNFGNQGRQSVGGLPLVTTNVRCIKELPVREESPKLLPSDGVLNMTSGNTISSGLIHDEPCTLVSATNSYNGYTYNNVNADNNGGYKTGNISALAEPVYHKLEVAKTDEKAAKGTAGWNTYGDRATWPAAWAACKAKAPTGAWRLPRVSELAWIYLNKSELQKTPGFSNFTSFLWSGAELQSDASYYLTTTSSTINATAKVAPHNIVISVRCVRELQ